MIKWIKKQVTIKGLSDRSKEGGHSKKSSSLAVHLRKTPFARIPSFSRKKKKKDDHLEPVSIVPMSKRYSMSVPDKIEATSPLSSPQKDEPSSTMGNSTSVPTKLEDAFSYTDEYLQQSVDLDVNSNEADHRIDSLSVDSDESKLTQIQISSQRSNDDISHDEESNSGLYEKQLNDSLSLAEEDDVKCEPNVEEIETSEDKQSIYDNVDDKISVENHEDEVLDEKMDEPIEYSESSPESKVCDIPDEQSTVTIHIISESTSSISIHSKEESSNSIEELKLDVAPDSPSVVHESNQLFDEESKANETLEDNNETDYPEDLNPFGDEEEDKTEIQSTNNPFGSSSDEDAPELKKDEMVPTNQERLKRG